jgi:hypothetical protein
VTYKVEADVVAQQQIMALPHEAAQLLPEIWTLLQLTPWAGGPVRRDNPAGALRTIAFGEFGLVTYLILEDQKIVDVLTVIWA